jgi:hypothetical protein
LSESVTSGDAWMRTVTFARSFAEAIAASDIWTELHGPLITIGGLPPRITAAVGALARAVVSRAVPTGTSTDPTPGGSSADLAPGGSAEHPKPRG